MFTGIAGDAVFGTKLQAYWLQHKDKLSVGGVPRLSLHLFGY